jgi:hypothetical protein
MVMNWMNTSFWIAYGLARNNMVIVFPNGAGLFLGILQGLLRLAYPAAASASSPSAQHEVLPQEEDEEADDAPEDGAPASSPPTPSSLLRRRSADDEPTQAREVI